VHYHRAEEIYIPLAGSAEFVLGDRGPVTRRAGDVIYVEPEMPHGFRTSDRYLAVYYLWQAGDLRQTSTFA
jgi:mannose-6-phosphate isomerase-like protein (cupin superfamily)